MRLSVPVIRKVNEWFEKSLNVPSTIFDRRRPDSFDAMRCGYYIMHILYIYTFYISIHFLYLYIFRQPLLWSVTTPWPLVLLHQLTKTFFVAPDKCFLKLQRACSKGVIGKTLFDFSLRGWPSWFAVINRRDRTSNMSW